MRNFIRTRNKFILDIIREEEGPFLFKIQLQYIDVRKGKKKFKVITEDGKIEDPKTGDDNNTISAEKLRSKVLSFFKRSQSKPETETAPKKKAKFSLDLNYDKIKLSKPKNNQIRAFVTVFSREDGVKIYDYFYKLKSVRFSSAIYLIISNEILKKHTIREMKLHEQKKKQQRAEEEKLKQVEEEKVAEPEKRLDLSSSIIKDQDHERSFSTAQDEEDENECADADDEDDSDS